MVRYGFASQHPTTSFLIYLHLLNYFSEVRLVGAIAPNFLPLAALANYFKDASGDRCHNQGENLISR